MEDVKVGRAVIWFIDCLIRLFRLPLIFPPISAILKPAKEHQSPIILSLVDQLANFRDFVIEGACHFHSARIQVPSVHLSGFPRILDT